MIEIPRNIHHRFTLPLAAMALAAGVGSTGCDSNRTEITDEQRAALKAELREELVRELRDEVRGQRPAARPPGPALSAGEREAIEAARARRTQPGAAPEIIGQPGEVTPPVTPREEPDTTAPTVHADAWPSSSETDTAAEAAAAEDTTEVAGEVEVEAEAEAGRELRPGTMVYTSAGEVQLVDLAVASQIVDRSPQNVAQTYTLMPETFFCYTVFDNPHPEATVTHIWRRGTRTMSKVELGVGKSPRWRTWSRQRTRADWSGDWSCEVLGPDGKRMGLVEFSVQPAR